MKKLLFILFLITAIGCEKEEPETTIYLSIKAVLTPTNVFIDCPDIPVDFQYDVYYEVNPGIYPFTYTDHNNVTHPLIGEEYEVKALNYSLNGYGRILYIDLYLLSTGAVIENY